MWETLMYFSCHPVATKASLYHGSVGYHLLDTPFGALVRSAHGGFCCSTASQFMSALDQGDS